LKKATIVTVFLILASGSFALEFRNTSWLMSREQVIASETGPAVSELKLPGLQQITFRAIVSGFPATIIYLLKNDQLRSASYTFKRDSDRRAFDSVKQDLTSRNGKPTFERENLVGWRTIKTEIALAHLADGTSYAGYWEKGYFAEINHLGESPAP
jgi:hypothetical protein